MTCTGSQVKDFSPLAATSIETLEVIGGGYDRTPFLFSVTPYSVTSIGEIPTLQTLKISGLTNKTLPDVSGLSRLQSMEAYAWHGISSFGSLTNGAAPQLAELTAETEAVACDEVAQVYASHPGLLINDLPAGSSYACQP